jgi:thioredoxin reductase (NADPH)
MRNEIKVYGVGDCQDTRNVLEYLDSERLNYNYVDLDSNEHAQEKVNEHNDGRRVTPTIELTADGQTRVLSNPGIEELADAIENVGLNRRGALDDADGWRKAS